MPRARGKACRCWCRRLADPDGDTALHHAARQGGELECARLLVNAKADRSKRNEKGQTALDVAHEKCHAGPLDWDAPPTQMMLCKADGSDKHERYFSLDKPGGAPTVAWANSTSKKKNKISGTKGPFRLLDVTAHDQPHTLVLHTDDKKHEMVLVKPKDTGTHGSWLLSCWGSEAAAASAPASLGKLSEQSPNGVQL